MANINLSEYFTNIANAIREKDGTTDPIPANKFPERIESIAGNGEDLFIKVLTGEVTNIEASDLSATSKITYYAFAGCTKLQSVTLPNSIKTIDSNVFEGCINLKTINVPWAEGVVANAPWGATNAIINYNYGG